MQTTYEELLSLMKKEYEQISGYSPNDASDVGIRMMVLAKELEKLWEYVAACKKQAFPTTAQGEYLDMHGKLRGIVRKKGNPSEGEVVFFRATPAPVEILIPKGTMVSTSGENPIRFLTNKNTLLSAGQTQAVAKVHCESVGTMGNVAANTISVMVTPVSGINGVRNDKMLCSGTEKEEDAQLRQRLLENYQKTDNGTNSAFYYHKVMGYEGITSAHVIPRENGVGTVGIIVDSYNTDVDKGILKTMIEDLNALKEINVDIAVRQAEVKTVDFTISLLAQTGYSIADAKVQCESAVEEYFRNLKVAQPLYVAGLIAKILSCPQIVNCKIEAPLEDVRPLCSQILRIGTLLIREMMVK